MWVYLKAEHLLQMIYMYVCVCVDVYMIGYACVYDICMRSYTRLTYTCASHTRLVMHCTQVAHLLYLMCMCVCKIYGVWVRERARARARESECVCVCLLCMCFDTCASPPAPVPVYTV